MIFRGDEREACRRDSDFADFCRVDRKLIDDDTFILAINIQSRYVSQARPARLLLFLRRAMPAHATAMYTKTKRYNILYREIEI